MSKFIGYFYLGTIVKPLALKGEMVVKGLSDFVDTDQKMDFLFIDINDSLTPFPVERIVYRKAGEAILKLHDISFIDNTKDFIKKDLYLPDSFQLIEEEGELPFQKMIGYEVVDKTFGNIGNLRDVLQYPQQEILSIHCKGKEILLPAVSQFILSINQETKIIQIDAPPGLLDLYLHEQQ